MSYTIAATVRRVGPIVDVTERMRKRELIVETFDNPKYPQVHSFEATGDRCSVLDGIAAGDVVEIEFSLRGREWSKAAGDVRVFNTLSIYSVKTKERAARHSAPPAGEPSTADNDPLPF